MCLLILYWFWLLNGYEQLGQLCFFAFIGRKAKKAEVPSLIFIFMPCRIHEIWYLGTKFVDLLISYVYRCNNASDKHISFGQDQKCSGNTWLDTLQRVLWADKTFMQVHEGYLFKWMIVQGSLFMQIPLTGFPPPPRPIPPLIVLWNENRSKSWLWGIGRSDMVFWIIKGRLISIQHSFCEFYI